jgi:hypothetical protein
MISRRWVWVAAVAVLLAGITNAHAHVHLCFDGQEPPTAVHLYDFNDDGDHLQDHGVAPHHEDVDVNLQSQALAKTVKYDLTAIEAVVAWTFVFERQAPSVLPARADTPPRPAPLYSHPPLRAPPR